MELRESQARSELELHGPKESLSGARAIADDFANSIQQVRAERDAVVDDLRRANLQLASAERALQAMRQQHIDGAPLPSVAQQVTPRRMSGTDDSVSGFAFDKCANVYAPGEDGALEIFSSRVFDRITMDFFSREEWINLQYTRARQDCENLNRGNALQPRTALA
jgi:hypothetical protein